MNDVVAVTGVGVICALGDEREVVSRRLRAGARSFAPPRRFDATTFKVNLAAEAPTPDFAARFSRGALRHTSRTDRLALWAADDALSQARLPASDRRHAAVFVGASTGGMAEMELALERGRRIPFATYWSYPVWSSALALGRVLELGGERATYMTACSSAAHALGTAMRRVRAGAVDVAVAGGAEALSRLTLAGFGALGVLDPEGTRPFDAARRGITLGEGAAFFVLERLGAAERRGAPILAVVAGYGASADAHHMIHPREDGAGAVLAIRRALTDAGLDAGAVDYVNAHGTGTTQNDAMEAKAVLAAFGARQLRISSTKSMIGHTLGAAAAVEAAACVLGMQDGFVPPNPGIGEPAPELEGLTLVRVADSRRPEVVVSTSFAFGGNNAALVLTTPEALRRRSTRPSRPALGTRTVVVSGAALSSAAGTAADAAGIWALLEAPATGTGLSGLDPGAVLGRAAIRRMDALSAATAATATLAKSSARLSDGRELGLAFGTSFGGLDATVAFLARLFDKGPALVNPLDFPNLVHNAGAGHTSMLLGAIGPNVASCQEEICADEAVRNVVERLQEGEIEAAIAGGGDLASVALDGAYEVVDRAVRTRSRHASVVAAVVLETLAACRRRGGEPWAAVLGIGAAGPVGGIRAAIVRAQAAAERTRPIGAAVDLWLRGATEALGQRLEAAGQETRLTEDARSIDVRVRLGDAAGAGAAALAVAAAAVRLDRARLALVTSVTREGGAYATLLGPLE